MDVWNWVSFGIIFASLRIGTAYIEQAILMNLCFSLNSTAIPCFELTETRDSVDGLCILEMRYQTHQMIL